MRNWYAIAMAITLLFTTGCPRPANFVRLGPEAATQGMRGRVELAAFSPGAMKAAYRHVQAVPADVATFATVSLIDTSTNVTVATTVTDGSGNFSLTLGNFTPVSGHSYYLEAVKGLFNNIAGKNAARLRSIIAFQNGGWVSCTNLIPNSGLVVDRTTTALSVIISLRNLSAIPAGYQPVAAQAIGALTVGAPGAEDAFAGTLLGAGKTQVAQAELDSVYNDVTDVLARNADPVAGVLVNTTPNGASPWFNYYETVSGFQANSINPTSGPIGTTVTLTGNNFSTNPAQDVVQFGNASASAIAVTTDQTQIQVVVPSGATSGYVGVSVAGFAGIGPYFSVTSNDGHSVFDNSGNYYVAGENNGAVYRISATGTLTQVATGFQRPVALLLDPTKAYLYVADQGASTVYKVTLSSGASASFGTGILNTRAMTLDTTGQLYLTDSNDGTVQRIPATGGAAATWVSGLNKPFGLGFNPNTGDLFVASEGANMVMRIPTGTTTPAGYAAGLNDPRGLAVDNSGNVFVASAGDKVVYKVNSSAVVSVFASGFQSLQNLAFDPKGNLYLSCSNNAIWRLTPDGGTLVIAAACGAAQGLVYTPSGDLEVTGAAYNNLARVAGGASPAAYQAFINNPGNGIATDSAGNLFVGSAAGAIYKVAPGASFATPILFTGGEPVQSLVTSAGGTLYGGTSWGRVQMYSTAGSALGTFANSPVSGARMIATDSVGNLYWANGGNGTVEQWNPTTQKATCIFRGMSGPRGVTVDSSNNVYASDRNTGQIWKYSSGATSSWATINVAGIQAAPYGLAIYNGSMFAADSDNNRVLSAAMTSPGTWTAFATTGLNAPHGLTVDPSGNVYVANNGISGSYASSITKISAGGVVTANWGTGLSQPYGISLDPALNLWIADEGAGVVFKVGPAGGAAAYWDNQNITGILYTATNIYGTDGGGDFFELNTSTTAYTDILRDWGTVWGLGLSPDGTVWVGADGGANGQQLHQVSASGLVDTPYLANNGPNGLITFDSSNNAIVANWSGGTITKHTVGATGSYTTIASGLSNPVSVTWDPTKSFYMVTEYGNNAIRKVTTGGTLANTYFWPYDPAF